MSNKIPNAVAVVVGDVLGEHYYSHRDIEVLFAECGAPGTTPHGTCRQKCEEWLKQANEFPDTDARALLGAVLVNLMDTELDPSELAPPEQLQKRRQRVHDILAKSGLEYRAPGRIIGGKVATPTRTLEKMLQERDLSAMSVEFERASQQLASDPAAAVTSACSILESLCKIYANDRSIELPKQQTLKKLWPVVQGDLGLSPGQVEDDDLKRVLSGLSSIVDGLGAFRTHAGSAHGRGRLKVTVA